jgi:iron complex outermembrane receptor protein
LEAPRRIATFDPPVGTYVDDIYLSRQNANNLSLFDVERVEVLRGPQGTLFGRNTTGGAINVIMREPGRDFGGYVELGYGRFNKVLGRASVDVPLADSVAIKLSGYFENDDGYAKNVTTGERLNDNDGWGARLGARAEASDRVHWTGSYMHIVSKGENILNFECNPANPSDCKGRFVTTGLREKGGPPSPYAPLVISGRKANYGLGQEAETDIVTSNLEIEVADRTTLSFITGYVSLTQQFGLDFFDGRGGPSLAAPNPPVRGFPRGGFVILNDGQHEQFTQEIKLNGSLGNGFVEYVGGFFYIDELNRTDFADVFSIFSPAVPAESGSCSATDLAQSHRGDCRLCAGGLQHHRPDQADCRRPLYGRDQDLQHPRQPPLVQRRDARGDLSRRCQSGCPDGVRIPRRQNTKIWTPRFAVNFQPNNDLLFFASADEGFKSGGWNARGTAPNQLLPFDPETVWSYEAGLKSDWLDGRFRANLTAFWLDVSDLQTISGLVNPTTGAITFLTRNFADYRNKGIEAEFTFLPIEGLNLYANIGYQDDNYRIAANQPATDIYGIQSIPAQAAACKAALAAGRVPTGPEHGCLRGGHRDCDRRHCDSGAHSEMVARNRRILSGADRRERLDARSFRQCQLPLGPGGADLQPHFLYGLDHRHERHLPSQSQWRRDYRRVPDPGSLAGQCRRRADRPGRPAAALARMHQLLRRDLLSIVARQLQLHQPADDVDGTCPLQILIRIAFERRDRLRWSG